MVVVKTVSEIAALIGNNRKKGKIGYVPTMGALHNGHLSLLKKCKEKCTITICSIFVNPTQFNDKSDFEKYPVKIEEDIALLIDAGCDYLFLPTVAEVYPKDVEPINYEIGELETLLEGKFRPGHFQGVCQVMHRFLQIINPNILYLGQKDYQQCLVIQKLILLNGFNTELIIGATTREKSGLAMSSRNVRLSHKDKDAAVAIYDSLVYIKENVVIETIESIQEMVKNKLLEVGFNSIDYVAICNAETLEILTDDTKRIPTIALIAANISGIRLIDNMLIY